jgi:hypothetical protein
MSSKRQRYNRRVPPDLQTDLEEMVLKIILSGEDPAEIASEVLYYVMREMRPDVFEDWKWGDEDTPKKTNYARTKPYTKPTGTTTYAGLSGGIGKTTSSTTTTYGNGTGVRDGLNYLGNAPTAVKPPVAAKKTETNSWGKTPPPPYRSSMRSKAGYHNYR